MTPQDLSKVFLMLRESMLDMDSKVKRFFNKKQLNVESMCNLLGPNYELCNRYKMALRKDVVTEELPLFKKIKECITEFKKHINQKALQEGTPHTYGISRELVTEIDQFEGILSQIVDNLNEQVHALDAIEWGRNHVTQIQIFKQKFQGEMTLGYKTGEQWMLFKELNVVQGRIANEVISLCKTFTAEMTQLHQSVLMKGEKIEKRWEMMQAVASYVVLVVALASLNVASNPSNMEKMSKGWDTLVRSIPPTENVPPSIAQTALDWKERIDQASQVLR